MAAITGIEGALAPQAPRPPERNDGRAAVEYGAALSHRDLLRTKERVDATGLAAKKRAGAHVRQDDPQRDPRALSDEERYAQGQRKGFLVDIEV